MNRFAIVGVMLAALTLGCVSDAFADSIPIETEETYSSFSVPFEDGGITYDSVIIDVDGTVQAGGSSTVIDGSLSINKGTMKFTSYNGSVDIGSESDKTGSISVSGANSEFRSNKIVSVGTHGEGSLLVADGASFSNENVIFVGANTGASGELTVSGEGSSLNTATLYLGSLLYGGGAGSGKMNVLDGASVTSVSGIYIGNDSTGRGELNVSGQDSSLEVISYYGSSIGLAGDSTVNITNGGEFTHSGALYAGGDGETSITVQGEGSALKVIDYDYNGYSVAETGTFALMGDAALSLIDGGKISAYDFTCVSETTSINIDLSSLCVADDYVAIDVEGTLTVNGDLVLSLFGDFIPEDGTTFNLFDWGSISFEEADEFNVNTDAITALGLSVDLTSLYTDGTVTIYGGGTSAVPEPGMVALLCIGLGVVGVCRKRIKGCV